MALADTVTGDGKVLGGSTETGSYTETVVRSDGSKRLVTTYFTDVRVERKWYALTLAAVNAYIDGHPNDNVSYTLVNEGGPIQGYEMTVQSVTRSVTGVTITPAPDVED